ncbi:hypothetical protein P879_04842 [Paragonimus westermani]|uniref:Uncharacterized protein n=1 Tax=Paragonimus westermani TaxID=34504 RepID=A0A8T0DUJ2_9TREM|nr:hypothetical protein P879_04842 [Paragonimus westermani]
MDRRGLIVRGRHLLRLDELSVIEREDPVYARLVTKEPILVFAPAVKQPQPSSSLTWSALNIELPAQIHLLSLIAWPLLKSTAPPQAYDQVLLRLEHLDVNSTGYGNRDPYQLDITFMFCGIRITQATEVTLTADQERTVAQTERLRWPTESPNTPVWSYGHQVIRATQQIIIFIHPGTIASFILNYKPLD